VHQLAAGLARQDEEAVLSRRPLGAQRGARAEPSAEPAARRPPMSTDWMTQSARRIDSNSFSSTLVASVLP